LSLEEFSRIPVRVVGQQPVTLGDVARVSDSHADQTNVVRVNGRRATYLNILKKADASTLRVVDAARAALPDILSTAPKGMQLQLNFDQSKFVRGAIWNVLREAAIAAVLVSAMILLFLGNWRSMVVVSTSIPLALFCSIIGLKLTDNSINLMTLGGLSL